MDTQQVHVIVTHNNRLQCFLKELLSGIMRGGNVQFGQHSQILAPSTTVDDDEDDDEFDMDDPTMRTSNTDQIRQIQVPKPNAIGSENNAVAIPAKKTRFFNGCIISLTIDAHTNEVIVDLVHTGDYAAGKPGKTYWVAKNDMSNPNYTNFKPAAFEQKVIQSPFPKQSRSQVFYMVRHGQAEHNVTKLNMKYDTSLVNKGLDKILESGKSLHRIIRGDSTNEQKISYAFVSDLVRTRETLNVLFEGFVQEERAPYNQSMLSGTKTFVLPCAHELNYIGAKGKTCDGNQSIISSFGLIQRENKVSSDGVQSKELTVTFADGPHTFHIDMSHYMDFYGNKPRQAGLFNAMDKSRKRCRDTNMISNALTIVNGSAVSGGKRARRGGTRKHTGIRTGGRHSTHRRYNSAHHKKKHRSTTHHRYTHHKRAHTKKRRH